MSVSDLRAALPHRLDPWTRTELLAIATRTAIDGEIASGRLVRLLPDRYVSGIHAESWETRARTATSWAGPTSMLAGLSALALWDGADRVPPITVAAPWEQRLRGPRWVQVRRFVRLPAMRERGALRAMEPAAAVVVAHSLLPPGSRAEAVYRPIRRRLVTAEQIAYEAERMAKVRGRRELLRRLEHADLGAESFLEEEGGAHVLQGPLLGSVVRQHRVVVEGYPYRLDAFDPASLTALEFDGGSHDDPEQRRADSMRDARLASVGIQTLRFTFEDTTGRPEWCRRIAEATVARRRADFAR
ncbi:endonuclease domain-containing protein [Demequina pelophila]|uniref:endonuclease domain-containing protein n=1 Tax=Demequina pelophila TaxID=1638984 RepID=UPI0007828E59|nr:hypothetical protein [Demequina pelophila]